MKRYFPGGETSGVLAVTYYARVSVGDGVDAREASDWLKQKLRQRVEESHTGQLTGLKVAAVTSSAPPEGSDYIGWTVGVTAFVDMDTWNRKLGPGQTAVDVVQHLTGVIKAADISESGARIDDAEMKMMTIMPA